MKRFLLVPVVSAAAVFVASPAHAQLGWPPSNRPAYAEAQRPYYESRRVAYDNGYREGLVDGEKDARSRDPFDFRDEGDLRNGERGYHRTYGDRESYRQVFRSGFEAGYSDGYGRNGGGVYNNGNGRGYGYGRAVPRRSPAPVYPSYPDRGPGYGYPNAGYGYGNSSPAYNSGLRDGIEKGREDAEDRDSFDPSRHRWYRDGNRDYRREYGTREQYRDVYQQAFREGYERGYRERGYRR
jgi:hypothetical protein